MPVAASHFSMVGFAIELGNEAALSQAVQKYLANYLPTSLSPSDLVCTVKDASGAGLRLSLRQGAPAENAELKALNPGFAGLGRTAVEIVGDASDPDWKPFEITLSARFSGEKTPLVFNLADPSESPSCSRGRRRRSISRPSASIPGSIQMKPPTCTIRKSPT